MLVKKIFRNLFGTEGFQLHSLEPFILYQLRSKSWCVCVLCAADVQLQYVRYVLYWSWWKSWDFKDPTCFHLYWQRREEGTVSMASWCFSCSLSVSGPWKPQKTFHPETFRGLSEKFKINKNRYNLFVNNPAWYLIYFYSKCHPCWYTVGWKH